MTGKKTVGEAQQLPVKHFFIIVDGKKYGPYLDERRKEFSSLEHKRGVEILTMWLKPVPSPPKPRKTKQQHPSLLEEVGFVPQSKQKAWGW
ncbi:MAG TPA: hypothetical protein DCZ63_08580 [Geobacter sp.]|nr:hypothetical protein [Geobacter sp.]